MEPTEPPAEPEASEPPLDAPERKRLPPLLRRAWFNLNQAFRRRIAGSGLTPDQFTLLRLLVEGPPHGMTQCELSEFMSSDPNTVASLLNRMEQAKLLQRCPHETDRRAHRVRLQPKGRKTYVELRAVAVALQGEVLAAVPESRRGQFLRDLERVANACLEQNQGTE